MHVRVSIEHKRKDGQSRVYSRIPQHKETVVDWNGNEVEQDDEDGLNDRDN